MNPNPHEKLNIKDAVLNKIRTGDLVMRSRLYFAARVALLTIVAIAVLVISILIFNFISFSVRISGHESLLGFGSRGLLTFFALFPWWLLLVDVALIIALENLLRQFKFGYKSPVLYLLGIILVLTIGVGTLLDRVTPFNDQMLDRAEHHGLPGPLGEFYESAHRGHVPDDGVCRCIITAINGETITAYDSVTGTSTVFTIEVPSDDPQATTSMLSVGDIVFIAGDKDGSVIRAFGISKFLPKPPPNRH